MKQNHQAKVLRPRILDALLTVLQSTSEVADRMSAALANEGAPHDIRGYLIGLPGTHKCCTCGHTHACFHYLPLGTGLIKPHLDAMAKAGLIVKISRGTARSALWTLADFTVPDTVDELITADRGGGDRDVDD